MRRSRNYDYPGMFLRFGAARRSQDFQSRPEMLPRRNTCARKLLANCVFGVLFVSKPTAESCAMVLLCEAFLAGS